MSNYWKNRAVNLENLIQEKTDEAVIKINELYSNSVKTINGHIEKIFNTYKNGGKIDREYALQLLSAGQTEKQRQELLEKLSKTTDKTAKQKIINILNAPAYADRISRLQALKDMVRAEAVTLGVNESDITTDNLINTSKESYYRTLYNDQIQCGKAYDFNTLSDKRLKAMLSQKWSGKNYSSRIWKNNDDFINRLEQTLEMGCLTGLSINEMEDVILNDCIGATSNEAQRFCASRLIRTETNHFANQGILMGYQQAGIERYRFLATLDIHTSEKCRSLDSKVFLVSEAETGVNLPPMHPFCRSVTVPDTASRNGTRWARDPVTGKRITVPADMTYNQWYDKYVKTEKALKNNDKGDIISSSFKSLSGIYHPITDESIKRVSKIDIPGFSDELNDTIYEQRKALLIEMQKQPVGTEGSVSVPLNGSPIPNVIIGNIGSTKINNLDIPYYSVHNHPNSDVMSPGDILGFTSKQYKNMIGLEALGNDGKTLYSIIKTQNSDTIAYREYITKEVANFKSIYPDIDVQKDYEKIRAFSLKLFERGDEYGFITTRCE